ELNKVKKRPEPKRRKPDSFASSRIKPEPINIRKNSKYAYNNGARLVVQEHANDMIRELNTRMAILSKEFKLLFSQRQAIINDIGVAMAQQNMTTFIAPTWKITVENDDGEYIARLEKI